MLASHTYWCVWKARNDLVFNNRDWSADQILSKALESHTEHKEALVELYRTKTQNQDINAHSREA